MRHLGASLFIGIFVFLFSCASFATIGDDLQNQGVRLEIHAAPQDTGHWVGTIRDPKDFFNFEFVSLLSSDLNVQKQFTSLKRHDMVRVWGKIVVDAPQKHIDVSRLVVEESAAELGGGAFHRQSEFPKNFPDQNTPFRALVHAFDKSKRLLVVEYQDTVLPVRLPASLELPDLYRGDIVEMRAVVAGEPSYPRHLKAISLTQKESIAAINGKPIEKTGVLVKFPKSSQIIYDVYALKEDLPDGLSRQLTIANFNDAKLFASIRAKLASFWNAADSRQIVNGRNKLLNPSVLVRIKGKANEVDPQQANPQILVDSLDDITLESTSLRKAR